MAVSLTHSFVSIIADSDDDTFVRPSDWNDEHVLTMGATALLGNPTGSPAEASEITLGTGLSFSSSVLNIQSVLPVTFVLGLTTNLVVNTNVTNKIVLPFDVSFVRVDAIAQTGPVGAALLFDINLNGTTIWSTQANRITIADGKTTGSGTTFNTTTAVAGDVLSIDVDQIGSTTPGTGVTVTLTTRSKLA